MQKQQHTFATRSRHSDINKLQLQSLRITVLSLRSGHARRRDRKRGYEILLAEGSRQEKAISDYLVKGHRNIADHLTKDLPTRNLKAVRNFLVSRTSTTSRSVAINQTVLIIQHPSPPSSFISLFTIPPVLSTHSPPLLCGLSCTVRVGFCGPHW